MNIWRNVPGGGAGSKCGDESQVAGTATASKQAAVAGGPAGAGHPRRTATMAGHNAGSGPMTLGAINRLGRDCGKIAQRQEKHRTTNDGPHKVTKYRGPSHNNFMISRPFLKGKHSLKPYARWGCKTDFSLQAISKPNFVCYPNATRQFPEGQGDSSF